MCDCVCLHPFPSCRAISNLPPPPFSLIPPPPPTHASFSLPSPFLCLGRWWWWLERERGFQGMTHTGAKVRGRREGRLLRYCVLCWWRRTVGRSHQQLPFSLTSTQLSLSLSPAGFCRRTFNIKLELRPFKNKVSHDISSVPFWRLYHC